MTADEPRTGVLDVPGAHLYHEVRGSGPPLLMIPGGPADSRGFTALASLLADDHAVITYDPRGMSRSTRDDPDADVRVETQAEDAFHLLTALTAEPALVLGCSAGAITGLALAARHPERVRTLVAHEPPVTELLPDAPRLRANDEELHELHRTAGAGAALARFLELTGLDRTRAPQRQGPPDPRAAGAPNGNFDLFFGHVLRPLGRYVPDVAALRQVSTRVVVASGAESAGQLAHRGAAAFAEELGTPLVEFPGDHGAPLSMPDAFAARLREVLAGAR
ncbi:alpha/beta fold hydrolase [Umezawaea beigongshangensis]|uniref:alpha/beta fold hydrolase n=1 Tax=Umezawaea beigongshangensis TaxID=2780383 RepID=UPI0027DB9D8D|nr:alpha/beta hydrolase [Umezawaea beigongshangensis]